MANGCTDLSGVGGAEPGVIGSFPGDDLTCESIVMVGLVVSGVTSPTVISRLFLILPKHQMNF